MNYFTNALLKTDSEPIFKESDETETIETIDTILKYKIESGFCFLEKYRKADGTFLVSLAYRVPKSVCNPILGYNYAEDTRSKTTDAVISSRVFQDQVLPVRFLDRELFPSFASTLPIKAHISMIAYFVHPLPSSDDSLFIQGIVDPYLNTALLKREGSAIIASGYNISYGDYLDEKHAAQTMKDAVIFAKVLAQETVSIGNNSYTSLTVKTPFCGNAEIIIDKVNVPSVNLVDSFAEFHISEATASFLPIPIKNNRLDYTFDDAAALVCKWFKDEIAFDNIEELFDDSIVVYKEMLKVASKKETALEYLKVKKRMFGNNEYPIKPVINVVKEVNMDEYDCEGFLQSMLKLKDVRKQFEYWKTILDKYDDHSLDELKVAFDASEYSKFENQHCITFFENFSFSGTVTINEIMFITVGTNGKIREIYFSSMPIFHNTIPHPEYGVHYNNIPITIKKTNTYVDVRSLHSYKKAVDEYEMMVLDPSYKEFNEEVLSLAKINIHSLFEDLKCSISEEEFLRKTTNIEDVPKGLKFKFTDENIPLLPLFMQSFFEISYILGYNLVNPIKELTDVKTKTLVDQIKERTYLTLYKDALPFPFSDKAREMFTISLVHFTEQNMYQDECTETLAYLMFLKGIMDNRE